MLCSSSFEMVSMFFLNPTEVSTFTSMVAKSNKCNEIKWVSFSRAAFFYSYSLSKTYFSSSTFNYTLSFPVVHQAVDKLDPLFSSLNCQHPLWYTQQKGGRTRRSESNNNYYSSPSLIFLYLHVSQEQQ